jgi:vacuolar-type H+-ATPase subunit H
MELTERQLAVLNYVVVNGQEWADNAKKESHVLEKVAKYESAYDEAVAKGNYKTRKQVDDANEKARQDAYDNASWDVKRKREYPSIAECVHAILDGKLEALQAKRKIVKTRYPKENN